MKYLDFHCDTIGECANQNKPLLQNDLHISLEKASCFENYGQVFAVWIPDEYRKAAAWAYYKRVFSCFQTELQKNRDCMMQVKTPEDLKTAFSEKKTAALLSVEGGAVLGGDLSKLQALYDDGVRLMTLTWNDSNEIGNGCFAENKGGLTPFGKDVVREIQKMHILVDVSHLNERGFYDVAANTHAPFVASHSDAQIVDNPYACARNLTDDQIDTLVSRKGLIGLNLCAKFLGNDSDIGMDAVLRHISHFLSHGAENILAFGCDFDGCTVHETLNGIDRLPDLFSYLLGHGISEEQLEKIYFLNGYRFLVANL